MSMFQLFTNNNGTVELKSIPEKFRNYTLGKVRQAVFNKAEKGQNCPCCGQLVKIYKRIIYSSMAYDLTFLYKLSKKNNNTEYFHVKDFCKKTRGGDNAKMVFWGLIEELPNTDDAKKNSGYWRITKKGKDFVENKISIQKAILCYNSEFLGFADDGYVNIKSCLGKKFNYSELMNT